MIIFFAVKFVLLYVLCIKNGGTTFSDSNSISTLQVPSAPINLTATQVGHNFIAVQWDEPESKNGILQGYKVDYCYTGSQYCSSWLNVTTNETHWNFTSLHPYRNYTLHVSAFTQVGLGDNVNITQQTLEYVPFAPTNLTATYVGHNFIAVQWDEPESKNGILQGYKVDYCYTGSQYCSSWLNVTTNETHWNFTSLHPYRNYTLHVSAFTQVGLGDNVNITQQTLEYVPSAPINLTATQVGHNFIAVQWDEPESKNGILQGYKVDYCYTGSQYCSSWLNVTTNETHWNFTSLHPYRNYTLHVSAFTQVGLGDNVNITQQTLEYVPSAPINLTATQVGHNFIAVQWDEPESKNGILQGYKVDYCYTGSQYCSSWLNVTANETHWNFTSLHPYRNYTLHVSAFTQVGLGDNVNITQQTLEYVPFAPTNLTATYVGHNFIAVQWDEPESKNGILQGYKVDYCYTGSQYCSSWLNVTTNETHWNFTSLHPYRNYTLHVSAFTQVGLGDNVNITQQTLEYVPSAPINLTATQVGHNFIAVQWDEPESKNGILQGYKVDYCYTGSQYCSSWLNVTANETHWNFTSLHPYRNYTLHVSAFTQVGLGDNVNITQQTLEYVPFAPTNLTATYVGHNFIAVQWDEPESKNGILQGYKVDYCYTGSQYCSSWLNVTTNETHWNFTSLHPYRNYTLHVSAFTQVGLGDNVNITQQTLEYVPSAPINLTATQVGHNFIAVQWDEPESKNGILQGYKVDYCYTGSQYCSSWLNVTTNETHWNFTSLHPYRNYTLHVSAFTQVGLGDNVNITQQTLEYVPSAPINLTATQVGHNFIAVQWDEPESKNGILQGYKVDYCYTGSQYCSSWLNVTTNETHWNFTSLHPYRNYTLHVSAFTQVGLGDNVNITQQTLEYVPNPPENFTCNVMSFSSIQLSWSKPSITNGLLVGYRLLLATGSATKEISLNVTQHMITDLKPYTNHMFYLQAGTFVGFGKSTNVSCRTKESVPSAPTNLSIADFNHDYVVLNWNKPDFINGELLGYKIKTCILSACSNFTLNNTTEVLSANVTERNVTNLAPYTTYVFYLNAFTSVGDGRMVNISQRTDEHIPGKIENLTIVDVNTTFVELSWEPPINKHGRVFYYVFAEVLEGPNVNNTLKYNRTNLTNFIVAPLERYILYGFTVVPFTVNGGKGQAERIEQRTLSTIPTGSPQDVHAESLSSTSIFLTWNRPNYYERNGKILEYIIAYNSSSQNSYDSVAAQGSHVISTNTTNTSYVVVNLNKYTFYTFTVRMVNDKGPGPASIPVSIWTQQDLPGKVNNLTCLASTNVTITITWLEPSVKNGIILGYRVTTDGERNTLHDYSANTTIHAELDLRPFQTYNFTVDAETEKGWGEKTFILCATDESTPDSPSNFKVESYGAYWIFVTWNEPAVKKGVITNYTIKVANKKIVIDSSLTHYNLTEDISPAKEYLISIAAATKKGMSDFSEAKFVTTKEYAPSHVRDLKHVDIGTRFIRISWNAPIQENGKVYYRVFQRNQNESESFDRLSRENLTESTFNVQNLEEFFNYTISVQAYTTGGASKKEVIHARTLATVPSGAVQKLELTPLNSTAIELSWNPVDEIDQNGIIDYYSISFTRVSTPQTGPGKESEELITQETWTVLSGLSKHTKYRISIRAHNQKGFGPYKNETVTTLQDLPGPPNIISIDNDTSSRIIIEWSSPKYPNGEIIGYNLKYKKTDSQDDGWMIVPLVQGETSTGIDHLEIYTEYDIRLSANTSIGEGEAAQRIVHTKPDIPGGPPVEIEVFNKTAHEIYLTWQPPQKPNGLIKGYELFYRAMGLNLQDKMAFSLMSSYRLTGLEPNNVYKYKIRCVNEVATGIFSVEKEEKTDKFSPPMPTLKPPSNPEKITPHTLTIPLWEASDRNGEVKYYYIIVLEKNENTNKKLPSEYTLAELVTYDEYKSQRQNNVYLPYIASKIMRNQLQSYFEIGSGHKDSRDRRATGSEEFINGPLLPDTEYYVVQRAHVTDSLYTSTRDWFGPYKTATKPVDPKTSNTGAIAGGVVATLVIVLIVVAALYYFRIRPFSHHVKDHKGTTDEGEDNEAFQREQGYIPAAHPIKTDNFSAYVRNLSKDGKYLFSEEFKLIQNGHGGYNCMYEHSNHPINRDKNRYNNIVAYDHTRVLLENIDGIPESDYINANYIDGYMGQTSYIATQGPLEATCDDFWRMCWEQNVDTIVMLTGLEENTRIKCHQYWPDVGTLCYGRMQLTLTDSSYLPTHVVRTFSLIHELYPGEERFIKHFHLLSWRDHGTPNSQELLAFIRRVNQSREGQHGPIVVHCSAGVGRTGTYIVLDVNLRRIHMESNIEIYNYLQHIRSQRNYMVQTEAQYIFIHDALLEYLTFGLTEVLVPDLRDYVKTLQRPVDGSAEMKLDKEFHKLNLFDQSSTKTMNAANASCNKAKNRFLNVLPFDDTRVTLRQLAGVHGSDYINANYIHGYRQAKMFIATQAPLPATIPDFWRMVWEHHCMTIICLSQETEGGKLKLHRYWPSIEAAMHGPLMIESVAETVDGDFVVRDFKVTHTTEGHSRTIKHFQYVGWPDNAYPESATGLVDMIGRVQKWHQQNGSGQIVVHCSAGVGRTGVFIALSNMIERVRVEGVVDIFQTVRTLRTQRPAMVQTKIEYLFCYLALQEFLSSFDIYQNFS